MNTIQLRAVAVVLDVSILILAVLIFKEFFVAANLGGPAASGAREASPAVPVAVAILAGLAIYGLSAGALRTSPGKRLLGLEVILIEGGAPGFFRAMFREQLRILEVFSLVSAFFSYLNVLESRPSQTDVFFQTFIHDRRRSGNSPESRVLGM